MRPRVTFFLKRRYASRVWSKMGGMNKQMNVYLVDELIEGEGEMGVKE